METLYTATATATGGREGHVSSDNKVLDLEVRMPKALGGKDDIHTNPEQLFAAGYAACFDSALNLVIRQAKVTAGTTAVTAQVSLGKIANGGYGLAVRLGITIPGVEESVARELAGKAHQVCPYSNATRGNIEVELDVNTK